MGSRFDSVQSLPPLNCLHETACAVMDQSTEGNEIIEIIIYQDNPSE